MLGGCDKIEAGCDAVAMVGAFVILKSSSSINFQSQFNRGKIICRFCMMGLDAELVIWNFKLKPLFGTP